MKKELNKLVGHEVSVNVFEIKRPALVSSLVGESIAQQIEKKLITGEQLKKLYKVLLVWEQEVLE